MDDSFNIDAVYDRNFYRMPDFTIMSTTRKISTRKRTPNLRTAVLNSQKKKSIARANRKWTRNPKELERTTNQSGAFASQIVIVNGIEYPSVILGKLLIQNLTTTPVPTPEGMTDNTTNDSPDAKFSNFLEVLFKFMMQKELRDAKQIYLQAENEFTVLNQLKRLEELGEYFNNGAMHVFQLFNSILPSAMRVQCAKGLFLLQLRDNGTLDSGMVTMINLMNEIYFEDEDVDDSILEVLNDVHAYPNTTRTAHEIVKNAFAKLLINPLRKLTGTAVLDRLVLITNNYIKSKYYPDGRRQNNMRKAFKDKGIASQNQFIKQNIDESNNKNKKKKKSQADIVPERRKTELYSKNNENNVKLTARKKLNRYNDFTDIEDENYNESDEYFDYTEEYYEIVAGTHVRTPSILKSKINTINLKHKKTLTRKLPAHMNHMKYNKQNPLFDSTYRETRLTDVITNKITIKKIIRKLTASSSESNKGDLLKRNLDDAFRHFDINKQKNMRRVNDKTHKKIHVPSSYEDYEDVLKHNIRKSLNKKDDVKKTDDITIVKNKSKKFKEAIIKAIKFKSSYSDDEELLRANLNRAFIVTPMSRFGR